jgi:light-regulated signal transduction histidine kinase (bacteriophytochrome)
VNSTDVPVISTASAGILDLTYSQLRAVSPIHIQYLKNMGVASSFSISLFYQKELWGLIACHNYTPRFIDYATRDASKLVGQILSAALEFRQHNANQQTLSVFKHNVDHLAKYLNSKSTLGDALFQQDINLMHIVHCSGAVLFYDGKQYCIGNTPDKMHLPGLLAWLNENRGGQTYYTSSFSTDYPAASTYEAIAAGVMTLPLSNQPDEWIIWFKEELAQQVTWAGNPDKPVSVSADGAQILSPRHSFATWTKEVKGRSIDWTPEELQSAQWLKEAILTSISTKASAARVINERLRLAYEELDTFSYTISHDLKTPLSAIKGYAQILAGDKTLSDHANHIINRIADRAEKMGLMIKAVLDYSRIGRLEGELQMIDTANVINEIIQDIEQTYSTKGPKLTLGDMPSLRGDPVMIWQLFSNLIGNAVKYSVQKESAHVHIEGWTSEDKVFYSIKDNGIGIARADLDKIFLLFSRMSNANAIEGSGVGLAIVKKIVEKHGGIIWAESELGIGTTLFLSFPIS